MAHAHFMLPTLNLKTHTLRICIAHNFSTGNNRHANAPQFKVYTYINVLSRIFLILYFIGNLYLWTIFSWALETLQNYARVRVMTSRTGNKP
jgi:hypothetical protein